MPNNMLDVINNLKQSKNKIDCLHKAYDALTIRCQGHRWAAIVNFYNLFIYNPNKLWNKQKRIICTNMNNLMKILLVKSGFFKEADIKKKWTLVWFISPHQYLKVKIDNNKYINIDIWGKANNIKFGDYAHGFH